MEQNIFPCRGENGYLQDFVDEQTLFLAGAMLTISIP